MSETVNKELHKKIIAGLNSKDSKIVIDSISQLREKGHLNDITLLFDLLISNSDVQIKDTIIKFLSDIKEKKADTIIIEAIGNPKYQQIQKDLIEICWQSSIDFIEYINIFTDLLIDSDFEIAFEAFTVIENFTGKLSEERKLQEQSKLKNAIPKAGDELKGMIHECIHIIDNF